MEFSGNYIVFYRLCFEFACGISWKRLVYYQIHDKVNQLDLPFGK